MERHMEAFKSGEELDPTDGTDHLGNIMACCAIIMDAREAGLLTDDRPPKVSHRAAIDSAEVLMAKLKIQYADKKPRHWTIADSVADATLPTSTAQGENHVATSFVPQRRRFTPVVGLKGRDPGAEEA